MLGTLAFVVVVAVAVFFAAMLTLLVDKHKREKQAAISNSFRSRR